MVAVSASHSPAPERLPSPVTPVCASEGSVARTPLTESANLILYVGDHILSHLRTIKAQERGALLSRNEVRERSSGREVH
jgi:hypothetical protein